jgi:polysaccharide export outer membrane protein
MPLPLISLSIIVGTLTMLASAAPAQTGTPAPAPAPNYRLGANDVVAVTVRQAPELNVTARVSGNGSIDLPLIGEIAAASQTASELELAIEARLRERFIRDPDVTVTVTEVRSHGVTVVGAVARAGVHQIHDAATLLEVLSMAGGVTGEAGEQVVIDRDGAEAPIVVKLSALLSSDRRANLRLQPGDLINVQTAGVIYVMGAVKKPGAYPVRGNAGVTVLRALAYGEGITPIAAQREAVVLRITGDGQRLEIAVDLEQVLKGKSPDVALESQDVLFVPISGTKWGARTTLEFLSRVMVRGFIP